MIVFFYAQMFSYELRLRIENMFATSMFVYVYRLVHSLYTDLCTLTVCPLMWIVVVYVLVVFMYTVTTLCCVRLRGWIVSWQVDNRRSCWWNAKRSRHSGPCLLEMTGGIWVWRKRMRSIYDLPLGHRIWAIQWKHT